MENLSPAMQEFLKIIQNTKWNLEKGGWIRHKNGCCPLAHAANRKLKRKKFGNVDFAGAGRLLGLNIFECLSILDATDNRYPVNNRANKLRNLLLTNVVSIK